VIESIFVTEIVQMNNIGPVVLGDFEIIPIEAVRSQPLYRVRRINPDEF
jgi:hypothetical protein